MNHSRKIRFNHESAGSLPLHPKAFVFFDKETGTPRFQVNAALDGSMPKDQAASLLALHCVARQQKPNDFSVMIAIGDDLVAGLAGQAVKLIRTCAAPAPPTHLTRRQHEVLEAVTNGLSNKEIASKLNLSERTVKFHVSTLLVKFEVRCRGSLMHKVANMALFPSGLPGGVASRMPTVQGYDAAPAQKHSRPKLPLLIPVETRSAS
ncbi:MAG: response regulator transcription factor [Candidatus Acidiferrales bacterium]